MSDTYLDKGLRRWIARIARKNAYRIAGYSAEDLEQEGLACVCKCYLHYTGKTLCGSDGEYHRYLPMAEPNKDNQKHFVSLVKVSFLNKISSLARRYPPVETPVSALGSEDESNESKLERLFASDSLVQEGADAAVMLAKAPLEIKRLFELLVADGLELTGRRKLVGSRESTDEKLSNLLGLEKTLPLRKMVAEYFLA